jgi:hypothetical protein
MVSCLSLPRSPALERNAHHYKAEEKLNGVKNSSPQCCLIELVANTPIMTHALSCQGKLTCSSYSNLQMEPFSSIPMLPFSMAMSTRKPSLSYLLLEQPSSTSLPSYPSNAPNPHAALPSIPFPASQLPPKTSPHAAPKHKLTTSTFFSFRPVPESLLFKKQLYGMPPLSSIARL